VIDDSDEPSRAGTPKPPGTADEATAEKSTEQTSNPDDKSSEIKDESATDKTSEGVADAPAAKPEPPAKPQELTPEIRQKLRKLEKLEATYPGKLRYWESNTAVSRMLTGVQSCYGLIVSPIEGPLPSSPSRKRFVKTRP
jgi:hypothetical protein